MKGFRVLTLTLLIFLFSIPAKAQDFVYMGEEDQETSGDRARDELLSSQNNLDQIPPDQVGYQDFEPYGHWVMTAEYGNIWVPAVDENWVPFRYGHWIWNPYYGWIWVADEPWGWRPFHYGRWVNLQFEGWAWIPGPAVQVWYPGVVRWMWNESYVGWCPLGPGEVYYPFYAIQRVYPKPFNAVRFPRAISFIPRNRLIRSIDPRPAIPMPRDSHFVPHVLPNRPGPLHREIMGRAVPGSFTRNQKQPGLSRREIGMTPFQRIQPEMQRRSQNFSVQPVVRPLSQRVSQASAFSRPIGVRGFPVPAANGMRNPPARIYGSKRVLR